VGLLWSGISRTRSSLQDIAFRTVVVYDVHPYVDGSPARHQPEGADALG
jgi:hypothetical protein